ncbi:MAG: hypothetical protein PF485_14165 [Bacteroidales bacterium]|jgi:hypothetical protein|nr:hypothetical protein [Bacteroidales bacterium]
MNKTRYLLVPLFIIGLFILGCTEEGLNEMDLMELSQKSSLSIKIQDERTEIPIYGATVTIVASGEALELDTDSSGLVYFNDLSDQEDVRINISKEGYFLYNGAFDIYTDDRSTGEYMVFELNSTDDAAHIYGTVSLQIDLTTPESEHPEGITINAMDNNNKILASTTTNSEGYYSISFPVKEYGTSVKMNFPTLQYNQTLKVRDTSNTVVTTTANGTVFNPYKPAEVIPNTSNVIATIEQPWYSVGNELWNASVKYLTIETGVITGLEFGYLGQGYYPWTNFSIFITSLEGGGGANITFNGENTSSYAIPYWPVDESSLNINSGGSGYPEHEPNENVYTISPSGFVWPNTYYYWSSYFVNERSKTFVPGEAYNMNVDYGTGTIIGDIPVEY